MSINIINTLYVKGFNDGGKVTIAKLATIVNDLAKTVNNLAIEIRKGFA